MAETESKERLGPNGPKVFVNLCGLHQSLSPIPDMQGASRVIQEMIEAELEAFPLDQSIITIAPWRETD